MPAEPNAPLMTHDEMRKKYDGKWVLISDYQTDPETSEIVSGRVLASATHREVIDSAIDSLPRPIHVAVECFRPVGDGTILVL